MDAEATPHARTMDALITPASHGDAKRQTGSMVPAKLTPRAMREVAPLTRASSRVNLPGHDNEVPDRNSISMMPSRHDVKDAPSTRSAKESDRAAERSSREGQQREGATLLGSGDALSLAVARAEQARAASAAPGRQRGHATSRETSERQRSASRAFAPRDDAARHGTARFIGHSASDDRHSSGATGHMNEPTTPVGGFRGLARWAAEQAGDPEASAAIGRTENVRAPMLQALHVGRRGWGVAGESTVWSLDAAARSEGIDVDEVAP